jgi:AraC-like DNA-binding protein
MNHTRVSTDNLKVDRRAALIRDTAFNLFNLEVDLGSGAPDAMTADIRVAKGPVASLIDVSTTWSVVERTRERATAAASGNLLVYLIGQGGSWFRNGAGQEFRTAAGSVVVGSQDAPYKAIAAEGGDWVFKALSVPEHVARSAAGAVRPAGYQLIPAHAPLAGVLSSYLEALCRDFATLDGTAVIASLKALDTLMAACLGGANERPDELAATVSAERCRCALRHMEQNLESQALSPASIAAALHISPRQMQRAFEASGKTFSAELRRLRVAHASALLRNCPEMRISDVALASGFDSLATFYRSFKAQLGATASDVRSAPGR